LWERSRGDFYRREYTGLYCGGCEQFLDADTCAEHDTPPERVSEENWFFRLSRYQEQIRQVLEDGTVRIEPAARRNEVLAFVREGLRDISVSRSAARAEGWGIPVPGDPDQVVYVWWDALANYVTALEGVAYRKWWAGSGERVHVIGKGIVRFHAVYWLALLLSAGEPLPTTILVHDYLTVDGTKLSKSAGNGVDPVGLAERFGTDALRWWLLRDVAPLGDTDFTADRLIHRHDLDLANGVGNFLNRTLSLAYRDGTGAAPCRSELPDRITDEVALGNRLVETERPWRLAGARRAEVVGELLGRCHVIAAELEPFLPSAARRLQAELTQDGPPRPVFTRLTPATPGR
jgi:methionyl-tRNA synthetase